MNTEKYLVKEKKKLNLYDVPTSYHGKLEKKEVKEVLIPENIKKFVNIKKGFTQKTSKHF